MPCVRGMCLCVAVDSVSRCIYHYNDSVDLWNSLLHLQPVYFRLWRWPRLPRVYIILIFQSNVSVAVNNVCYLCLSGHLTVRMCFVSYAPLHPLTIYSKCRTDAQIMLAVSKLSIIYFWIVIFLFTVSFKLSVQYHFTLLIFMNLLLKRWKLKTSRNKICLSDKVICL